MTPGVTAIPKQLKGYPLLAYIWQLMHRYNSNFILLIVGLPGKGKSYAALCFYYWLMLNNQGKRKLNEFNAIDNIGFSFQEFASLVSSNNSKGDVIIWEEAATLDGANARTFYEHANLYMSSLFQTMRYKNQMAILTLPSNHYLDKQLRQVCHATLVMMGHDDKKSWGKFYLHSYNAKDNSTYDKFPKFFDKNKQLVKIKSLQFPLPPKWLVDAYESKQMDWKNKLQVKVNAFMEREKIKESIKEKGVMHKILDVCKPRWEEFYDFKKKRFVPELILDDDEVRDLTDLSLTYARSIAKTLEIKKDKGTLV